MFLLKHTKPKMVVSEEGKHIRGVNDVYVPEHTDEEGNVVEEHFPYFTTVIFVPDSYTEEQMNEDYIEENIDKQ